MTAIYGKTLGSIFLILVIFITVASSIFIKTVYEDYPKPFAFTFFNNSFLVVLIIVYFIKEKIKESVYKSEYNKVISDEEKDLIENSNRTSGMSKDPPPQTSVLSIILLAFLWYLGNAFYNLGLSFNNISFSNTLSNLAIIFIFIEKIVMFNGKCSFYKIIGSICAFSGLILITIYQKKQAELPFFENESIIGDIYIILGALFYSFYAVFVKHFSKKDPRFDMMLTFGLVGFFTLTLVPIVLLFLHIFNLELFEFPGWYSYGKIFLNALIASLISDLLQSYSLVLLSPHLVSFGLILTIPLSILYDYIFPEKNKEIHINPYFIFGTLLLITSIAIVVYESYMKAKIKEEMKEKLIADSAIKLNN